MASLAVVSVKLRTVEGPNWGVTMKPEFSSPKFRYFVVSS